MSSARAMLVRCAESVRAGVCAELCSLVEGEAERKIVERRFNRMFDYNVLGGKMERSTTLVNTFLALSPSPSQTQMSRVCHLGWSMEMLQAFLLIADDIMDKGKTRRGKPCWYTLPDIDLSAANDSFLIENAIEMHIRSQLKEEHSLPFVLKALHQAKLLTILGQTLDVSTKAVEEGTVSRYREIVRLKTSHYSFFTPMEIALLLTDTQLMPTLRTTLRRACYSLGYLFQAQDDYLDCYGDERKMGKKGSDIAEGKCTWPLVTSLSLLPPQSDLLNRFKVHYGREDDSSVKEILRIYDLLEIQEKFQEFEKLQKQEITNDIDAVPNTSLQSILTRQLAALVGREK